jgi:hypothetical protein
MEILILAFIVILIIAILFLKGFDRIAGRGQKQIRDGVKETLSEIKFPAISVSLSTNSMTEHPDTGPVSPSKTIGWILNPNSTFPLTIYNAGQNVIQEVKEVLDAEWFRGPYGALKKIVPLVARFNIRCREIDLYIKNFREEYFEKLNEYISGCEEWLDLSELDKADRFVEFKRKSFESLNVRPYFRIEMLFLEDVDHTVDDLLIEKFGYEALRFYFNKKKEVHVVPADHYDRGMFERLVGLGLAIRGDRIPTEEILKGLTLKKITEMFCNLNIPKFGRKIKAIEYAMSLPDIKDRLNKNVSMRSLFQLQPLPPEFKSLDLKKLSDAWKYSEELSELLVSTYYSGGYAADHRKRHLEYQKTLGPNSKGWEISGAADCCPFCRKIMTKKFPPDQYPTVPLHVGCRCMVLPILD